MDEGQPSTSIQEPGASSRTVRSEAPVDSMLKDMATIIFSTFLLAGWLAFVIIYPKVENILTYFSVSNLLTEYH